MERCILLFTEPVPLFNRFFSFALQVNGKDVSNLPHEDAVNEFLKAEEPILVEVKRRLAIGASSASIEQSANAISGGSKVTATNESPEATKLSSGKSIVFGSPQQQHCDVQPAETTSVAIQTELMLCDFENEYICQSNGSPIRSEHHLNGSQINHGGQHNGNNNNNNGPHHSLHHCAMLNDCIVPPEIDIEVSV